MTDVSSHAIRRCGASAFLPGRLLGLHELRIVSVVVVEGRIPFKRATHEREGRCQRSAQLWCVLTSSAVTAASASAGIEKCSRGATTPGGWSSAMLVATTSAAATRNATKADSSPRGGPRLSRRCGVSCRP